MTSKCSPRVPPFCSYHILTSSVIYYWTDARKHGIHFVKYFLVNECVHTVLILGQLLHVICENNVQCNVTEAWDLEDMSPDRIWFHDLLNTRQVIYPLSYENSWRARSFNWVLSFWVYDTCLLHTAAFNSEHVVNNDKPQATISPSLINHYAPFYLLVLLGTPFMARLHEQLKFFVNCKISTDPAWQGLRIYLSGHEVSDLGLLLAQL